MLRDSTSDSALPICTDFARLRAGFAQALRRDPILPSRPQAALLKIAHTDESVFDSINRTWSQCLYDAEGHVISAYLMLSDEATAALRKQLDNLWRSKKSWDLCFGWLHQRAASLQFTPVSQRCVGETKWRQLSLG